MRGDIIPEVCHILAVFFSEKKKSILVLCFEDNIKVDLTGIEYEDVNLIHLTQDRIHWLAAVNTYEHSSSAKGGNSLTS